MGFELSKNEKSSTLLRLPGIRYSNRSQLPMYIEHTVDNLDLIIFINK